MINLLPPFYKKVVNREILRRFIVVFGLGLAFLVFVEAITTSLLYFTAGAYLESFKNQMSATEDLAKMKNLVALEENVVNLNDFLESFSSEKSGVFSEKISSITRFLPPSLKITVFSFESEKADAAVSKVHVSGFAGSRDDLLDFVSDLKRSGEFESVQSPVSNMLAEKDFSFRLEIELKK